MAKRTPLVCQQLENISREALGNTKTSSVSTFDGDTESMPFIGEGNSAMWAWPVTFVPVWDAILETDTRTYGTDSVST